jgi:hypothetical protein
VEAAVVSEGKKVPRALRLARRGIPLILRGALLPEGTRDPVSGFRAYRVSVLKRALAGRNGSPLLSTDGWAANVELIAAVAPHSRRIDGLDIERRYDLRQRASRFRPWSTVIEVWNVSRQIRRASADAVGPEPPESR